MFLGAININPRRSRYPKGYIDPKTGKSKAGQFVSKADQDRLFVKENLRNIARGAIDYKTLSTREKRIYQAQITRPWENTFYFQGKRFYDYTGTLKDLLFPTTGGDRNLTNYYTKRDLEEIIENNVRFQKNDPFRQSWYSSENGKDLKFYKTKTDGTIKLIEKLKKMQNAGYSVEVDGQFGTAAIQRLRDFEREVQEENNVQNRIKNQQPVTLRIDYSIKINPFKKIINVDTSKATWTELEGTP